MKVPSPKSAKCPPPSLTLPAAEADNSGQHGQSWFKSPRWAGLAQEAQTPTPRGQTGGTWQDSGTTPRGPTPPRPGSHRPDYRATVESYGAATEATSLQLGTAPEAAAAAAVAAAGLGPEEAVEAGEEAGEEAEAIKSKSATAAGTQSMMTANPAVAIASLQAELQAATMRMAELEVQLSAERRMRQVRERTHAMVYPRLAPPEHVSRSPHCDVDGTPKLSVAGCCRSFVSVRSSCPGLFTPCLAVASWLRRVGNLNWPRSGGCGRIAKIFRRSGGRFRARVRVRATQGAGDRSPSLDALPSDCTH